MTRVTEYVSKLGTVPSVPKFPQVSKGLFLNCFKSWFAMKVWKKFILVNAGALGGISVSLFLVSPNTSLWLWGSFQ